MKLTKLELEIFRVVWKLGNKATVHDIVKSWEDAKKPQYTTILKMLQLMEEKGLVSHEKSGRSYLYVAKVSKDDALDLNLRQMTSAFFNGDRIAFAETFINKGEFSLKEIQDLKRMIEEKEKDINDTDS